MRTLRGVVAALVALLLLSACDFSIYKMPLPGGADTGEDPMTVTVEFPDVLDLVPQSTVKLNDVTVGKVTDIELDGWQARVEMELRRDIDLPDNALAEIRQTSLLGEKFVSLSAPEDPSPNQLGDGDVIGVESTNRNPEVEEVLGAMSLLLNGGGVAQLKTITSELNNALEGREDSARSVLNQIRIFMREIDANKADIVNTIESLNELAVTANRHSRDIESALDNLPAAVKSLDRQRADLVRMLRALSRLGQTGTQVIRASKASTIDALQHLQPVLGQLAAADEDFVEALHVFLTYPFVDDVVGRDPNVARNLHMGDFTNLSVQMDVRLGGEQDPGSPLPETPDPVARVCVTLQDLRDGAPLPLPGDPRQLCRRAQRMLDDCLANPQDCPRFLRRAIRRTVTEEGRRACTTLGIPPALCPTGGGGGGGDDDPLGDITDDLTGGLNRPAFGTTVPLTEAMDRYDPVLAALLLPGVAR